MRLPRSEEIERAVLGSTLLDERLFVQTATLAPQNFVLDAHRRIYRCMIDLADSGCPIDTITLAQELGRRHELEAIGGAAYLTSLTDGLPKGLNIAHYVRMIREMAGKRYLIAAADAVLKHAQNGATLADLQERCAEIPQRLAEYSHIDGGKVLKELPDPLELDCNAEPWLIPGLLLRGGITLISGAPGDGKTWQALAIARAVGFGGELYGRQCVQEQVLMLDRENPKSIIQARWKLIFQGPVRGRIALWAGWSGFGEVPAIDDPRLTEIAQLGPLLIFDSLIRFHKAEENSSAEMAPVMAQLRTLANRGASILVLHHRGKNDLNRYRGSSEIVAGVDIACTLMKDKNDLLSLDVFKPRGTAEFKLTIQPDYQTGQFRLTDLAGPTDGRDHIAALAKAIGNTPGINQKRLIQQVKMSRTTGTTLLRANEGKLWRSEAGPRGSLRYFPITCTESRPVPGIAGIRPA